MCSLFTAVASNWEISNKIVGMVIDNASNMKAALRSTGFNMVNCYAHTLQLAIHDALDESSQIQAILVKCRAIVGHFKRSNISKAKLVTEQKKLNVISRKLIQDVKTRWNSTYYMMERILEQRKPVTIVLADTDLDNLTNSEWNMVDAVIEILEPFEWATRALSADKYATLSMVIPLMSAILIRLRQIRCSVSAADVIRKSLIKAVETRFSELETNKLVTSACLLDPRFKGKMFIDTSRRIAAVEELRTELSILDKGSNQILNIGKNLEETSATKKRRLDFWETVAEQCENTLENNYTSELDCYLNEPCVNKENDALIWWQENKKRFPLLFNLSLKYLCIPATSCASERVFSKAGEIVSAKRSKIKPKNVNNLIFLNKNYSKLNN